MWVLCIISVISSSFMVYPSSLATCLIFSKSIKPALSVSYKANSFFRPSLDFVSPNRLQMISRNSSKFMGLFLLCKSLIIVNTTLFLLSKPSSSRIFWISAGSIVPPWSSSKRSNVAFSYWRSCYESLSRGFNAALGWTTGAFGFVGFMWQLNIKYQI